MYPWVFRYCLAIQETSPRAAVNIFLHVAIFVNRVDLSGPRLHHSVAVFLLSGPYIAVAVGEPIPVRRGADLLGKPIYAEQFDVVRGRRNPSAGLRNRTEVMNLLKKRATQPLLQKNIRSNCIILTARAASIRVASSVWWFFTLIMVSSYTANLAAFLVIENKSSKIDSVDDLKDCGVEGKECPVQFGAKIGGATLAFFRESTNPVYQQMYKYMMDNPSLLTTDNVQGIDRVYNGIEDYAFIMESASIEYTIERKCNLTQVGAKLDDKNYGIGMSKSNYQRANMTMIIIHKQCIDSELKWT